MGELLEDAKKRKYAVPCVNSINLDMTRGIIRAAEEVNSPVILCHAEVHFKYTPLEVIGPILVQEMERAKVPVVAMLDHGKEFSNIMTAMQLGFNAIMFDGSQLSYEENVKQTKEIVKIAKEFNVSVEGELGYVTRPKSGAAEGDDDDSIIDDTSMYTDPQQAADFVEETGVDTLAVAFGTVHGIYLKEPQLDIERLGKISDATGKPLVMHGGSGLSTEDFSNSIDHGISKINYYTNMALDVGHQLKNEFSTHSGHLFYHDIMMKTLDIYAEEAKKVMEIFRSGGKA